MDKFKNKYRILFTCLQNWGYGRNVSYFVNFFKQNRECFFCNNVNGKINFNGYPFIYPARKLIFSGYPSPKRSRDNQFVFSMDRVNELILRIRVHILGIYAGNHLNLLEIGRIAEKYWHEIPGHFPFVILGGFIVMPNHIHGDIIIDKNLDTQDLVYLPLPSKKIASIIRGFKIGLTKNVKPININFKLQPCFYAHIICNGKLFSGITGYIYNNPLNWNKYKFNNT